MVSEVLKICKKSYLLMYITAKVKQQKTKGLVVSYNFLSEVPSKLEMQCKTGICFAFNFAWYSIKLDVAL